MEAATRQSLGRAAERERQLNIKLHRGIGSDESLQRRRDLNISIDRALGNRVGNLGRRVARPSIALNATIRTGYVYSPERSWRRSVCLGPAYTLEEAIRTLWVRVNPHQTRPPLASRAAKFSMLRRRCGQSFEHQRHRPLRCETSSDRDRHLWLSLARAKRGGSARL